MGLLYDFVSELFSNFLLELLVFIVLIRVESYFGLYERIKRYLYSTFKKMHIMLSVDYDTNMEIIDIKDIIKDKFKDSYGSTSIDVKSICQNDFEFMVKNEFSVIVQKNVNEFVTFKTSKITSTKKEIKNDIRVFLDTVREIETEASHRNNCFDAKNFAISLYVPYVGTYMKFYEPRGIKIKKYIIELDEIAENEAKQTSSSKYGIQLTGDIININFNYRDQISEIIDKFV